jgi:FkbM family methyltransferase
MGMCGLWMSNGPIIRSADDLICLESLCSMIGILMSTSVRSFHGLPLVSVFSTCVASPFKVISLPLGARIYRAGYRSYRSRWERTTARLPARGLYRLLARLGLCGRGWATVQGVQGPRPFSFRAANTQFHSLYLPQFAGGYEPETQLLIQILAGAEGVFFDIGANWGHLSVALAAVDGFHGEIHAFEPSAAAFRDLSDVTRRAHGATPVTCHQVGLSDRNGTAMLWVPDGLHSGLAQITLGTVGEPVILARLDELELPAPTVIKLDLEGGEHHALLGARATLQASNPYVILETWRGDAGSAAALRFLEDGGYQLYEPFLISHRDLHETYPYGRPLPPQETVHLALCPFTVTSRDEVSEHFNAFACPKSRFEAVMSKFAARSVSDAMEI